jgi:uncharacterized protein (TIGR02284 family)
MTDIKHDRTTDRTTAGGTYAASTETSEDLIRNLNKLLRGELSATETYRQALDKIGKEYGRDAKFHQLAEIQRDHENAASELRGMIERRGGEPSDDSGAWGTWSKSVMGTARLLGDKTALNALQSGEKSGLDDYQDVIKHDRTPDEVGHALRPFLARNQEHIQQLDMLIQAI